MKTFKTLLKEDEELPHELVREKYKGTIKDLESLQTLLNDETKFGPVYNKLKKQLKVFLDELKSV